MPDTEKTLYYLDELPDFKVASDDCDVRGWTIADANGRTIGRVDGLLVSKATERVVYLDVEVTEDVIAHKLTGEGTAKGEVLYAFPGKDGDDHLIIPVEMVKLDEEAKRVTTPRIQFDTFASAGRFPKGMVIERDYEIYLQRHFTGEATGKNPDAQGDAR
jgi:hypothetical protein